MNKCDKHGVEMECLAGHSGHPDNWYCPACETEKHLHKMPIPTRFTIEDGILYFGRDNNHHGYNLGAISDTCYNTLLVLNYPIEQHEKLQAELIAAKVDRSFYNVTVAERDYERVRNYALESELKLLKLQLSKDE